MRYDPALPAAVAEAGARIIVVVLSEVQVVAAISFDTSSRIGPRHLRRQLRHHSSSSSSSSSSSVNNSSRPGGFLIIFHNLIRIAGLPGIELGSRSSPPYEANASRLCPDRGSGQTVAGSFRPGKSAPGCGSRDGDQRRWCRSEQIRHRGTRINQKGDSNANNRYHARMPHG